MSNEQLSYLNINKTTTDCQHHNRKEVKKCIFILLGFYSPNLKIIFLMDVLSDHIKYFDLNCNLLGTILP